MLIHRWILSFNPRAEISRSCTEIAGIAEGFHKKKKTLYKKDEADIQNAMYTIVTAKSIYIL